MVRGRREPARARMSMTIPVHQLREKLLTRLGQAKFSFVNTRLILQTGIDLDASESYDEGRRARLVAALHEMGVLDEHGEVSAK